MGFDFETLVDRRSIGNLKYISTPEVIKSAGTISYAGAEMDFKTAPVISEAISKTAQKGLFGYTLCDKKYLDAVTCWMHTRRNWEVKEEWIVPTYGTIHSLSTAIRAFTNAGDAVIVQNPVYSRYKQAMDRNCRETIVNPLVYKNGGYEMDFGELEACMSRPEAKLMVLCNPHNPVCRVWSREELERVASLAKKYGVYVFSDEIFAEITFNGNITPPFCTIEGAKDISIVSTSLGKVFNFTGVNHANMIIPNKEIRDKFSKQRDTDHYGSIDPFLYSAICAAYNNGSQWVDEMLEYVWQNIVLIQAFFKEYMPQVTLAEPQGSFTVWIDWHGLGLNDEELYNFLQNEAFLELDPGSHYGTEGIGFSRMSIATPRSELEKSLELLLKAAKKRGFARNQ